MRLKEERQLSMEDDRCRGRFHLESRYGRLSRHATASRAKTVRLETRWQPSWAPLDMSSGSGREEGMGALCWAYCVDGRV